MEIRKVAIIGAGLMGHGIAQAIAQTSECNVCINDVNPQLIDKGIMQIKSNLKKRVAKGEISSVDSELILSKIFGSADLKETVKHADLVIEAVPEDFTIKLGVLKEIGKYCERSALIASNTSSIRISSLASALSRPERFVGLHFFNPPQTMRLVEIIRGEQTSEDTLQRIVEFSKAIGKEPIVINKDVAGFVVNRIFVTAVNEAVSLLDGGVASAEDIDSAVRLGLNWPMGPLALIDFVGVDTVLAICKVMNADLGSKYAPSPLLEKMVKQNLLGRKTGKGFYDWIKRDPKQNAGKKVVV